MKTKKDEKLKKEKECPEEITEEERLEELGIYTNEIIKQKKRI